MEEDIYNMKEGLGQCPKRIRKCACGCPPGLPVFRFPDINKPHTAARRNVWLRLLDVQENEHILDKNNKFKRVRDSEKLYACYRHFSYRMRSGRNLFRHSVPDRNIKGTLILPSHYGPPTKITSTIINTDKPNKTTPANEAVSTTRLPVEPRGRSYKDYLTFMEISPQQYEGKLLTVKKSASVVTDNHSTDATSTAAESVPTSVKKSASEVTENNSTDVHISSSVCESPSPSIDIENMFPTTVDRSTSPIVFPAESYPKLNEENGTISVDINSFKPRDESCSILVDECSIISLDETPLTTTYPPEVEMLLCHDKMPIEYDEKKMMAIVGRVVQTDDYLSANTPRKQKLYHDIKELQQKLELLEVELKVKNEELKIKDNQLAIKDQKFKIIENEVKIKDNALQIKVEELKIRDNENKKLVKEYLDYIKKNKPKEKTVKTK